MRKCVLGCIWLELLTLVLVALALDGWRAEREAREGLQRAQEQAQALRAGHRAIQAAKGTEGASQRFAGRPIRTIHLSLTLGQLWETRDCPLRPGQPAAVRRRLLPCR